MPPEPLEPDTRDRLIRDFMTKGGADYETACWAADRFEETGNYNELIAHLGIVSNPYGHGRIRVKGLAVAHRALALKMEAKS